MVLESKLVNLAPAKSLFKKTEKFSEEKLRILRVGTHYPLTHPPIVFFGWVGTSKYPEKPNFV